MNIGGTVLERAHTGAFGSSRQLSSINSPEQAPVLGGCSLGKVSLGIGSSEIIVQQAINSISSSFESGNRGLNAAITSKLRKNFGELGAHLLTQANHVDRNSPESWRFESVQSSRELLSNLRQIRLNFSSKAKELSDYISTLGVNVRPGISGDLSVLIKASSEVEKREREARKQIIQDTRFNQEAKSLSDKVAKAVEDVSSKLSQKNQNLTSAQETLLKIKFNELSQGIAPLVYPISNQTSELQAKLIGALSDRNQGLTEEQRGAFFNYLHPILAQIRHLHVRVTETLQERFLPTDETISIGDRSSIEFKFNSRSQHSIRITNSDCLLESEYRVSHSSDPRAFLLEVRRLIEQVREQANKDQGLTVVIKAIESLSGITRSATQRTQNSFRSIIGHLENGMGCWASLARPELRDGSNDLLKGVAAVTYNFGADPADWKKVEFKINADRTRSLTLSTQDQSAKMEFDLGKGALDGEEVIKVLNVIEKLSAHRPLQRPAVSKIGDRAPGLFVETLLNTEMRAHYGLEFIKLKRMEGGIYSNLHLQRDAVDPSCRIDRCGFLKSNISIVHSMQLDSCVFGGDTIVTFETSRGAEVRECKFGSDSTVQGNCGSASSVLGCFFGRVPKNFHAALGVVWQRNETPKRWWFGNKELNLGDL